MTNHPRSHGGLVVAKRVLLACALASYLSLLAVCLFWYLPGMRKLSSYQERSDYLFNASEDCWSREMAAKRYEKASTCFDDWLAFDQRNNVPDTGIDWPWATWKEAGR